MPKSPDRMLVAGAQNPLPHSGVSKELGNHADLSRTKRSPRGLLVLLFP